jgi:hypothetical protein
MEKKSTRPIFKEGIWSFLLFRRKNMPRKYILVGIPTFLIKKVEARLKHGYTSRADFIKQSIRKELNFLDNIYGPSEEVNKDDL